MIGRRIRELRWERGLSQDELATRAGTYQWTICRIENGYQQPSWSMVVKLLEALDAEIIIRESHTTTDEGEPR